MLIIPLDINLDSVLLLLHNSKIAYTVKLVLILNLGISLTQCFIGVTEVGWETGHSFKEKHVCLISNCINYLLGPRIISRF